MGFNFGNFSTKVQGESLTVSQVVEDAPYLSTTSNKGNLRVNAKACKLLGVNYSEVNTETKQEAGVRIDFKRVKWAGEEVNTVFLLPLGSKKGCKLASPGKVEGGILICSSTPAWDALEGNEETLKWYTLSKEDSAIAFDADGNPLTLADAIEHGIVEDGKFTQIAEEHGLGTAGEHARVYFKLTYSKEEAKRKSSGGGRPKATDKTVEEAPFAEDQQEDAMANDFDI